MEKKKVESVLVFGDATVGNPDLRYVVGASLARGGIYVKRQSHDPTLIVSNIDVGSARLGRVRNIRTYSDYGLERLSGKYDRDGARARFYEKIIRDTGASGPIVLAGRNETSNSLLLIDSLRKKGIKVVGEKTPTILEVARETKERSEIEKLREMGRKSSDPHYDGKSGDLIRAGEPIVFDIFPAEPDGYWHDCTRTYAFSSPQRKVKEMYDAVLEAQTSALDMVREQASCSEMMIEVCKLFEKKGYPTARLLAKGNKEARVRGFMHGLGHGVGLTIGERPYLSLYGKERLRKNSVVTIEPGLYDPKVGGVRIEDIVVVGSPSENLTDLPKDLQI